ncbi:MAG: S49 family peptidase [Pseudomonadota bacterium]
MGSLWSALRAPFRFLGGNKPRVTLLPLSGPIMAGASLGRGLSANGIEEPLKKAFKDKSAKAVVLAINSPGGAPTQARMIMERVRHLARETQLPVISYIEDVGASGGYMIAIAGEEIWADPFAIVGSIGVVSSGFGFHEAIEKVGIERRVYQAGTNKVRLDPFRPQREEDSEKLEKILSETHTLFIDMVKSRRGDKLTGPEESLYSGDFFLASEAQGLGLIDEVGDLRAMLKDRFGQDVQIRPISTKKGGLLSLLGSRLASAMVDGVIARLNDAHLRSRLGR